MYRDSMLWTVGLCGALVVGLAAELNNAVALGIPDSWAPFIRLGALLVGIGSGYAKSSPLPRSGS